MSPIVPSLPSHLVQLGFDYVLAVEAGDDVQAARLAPVAPVWPPCGRPDRSLMTATAGPPGRLAPEGAARHRL